MVDEDATEQQHIAGSRQQTPDRKQQSAADDSQETAVRTADTGKQSADSVLPAV